MFQISPGQRRVPSASINKSTFLSYSSRFFGQHFPEVLSLRDNQVLLVTSIHILTVASMVLWSGECVRVEMRA